MKMETQVPEPYRGIIDEVCAEDARWFEEHPGETSRVRDARDGELWPLLAPLPPVRLVGIRVTLIEPGVRAREAVLEGVKNEAEGVAWQVYSGPAGPLFQDRGSGNGS